MSTRPLRVKLDGIFAKGIIQGTNCQVRFSHDIAEEPCVYCGGISDSWEHVIPRSSGGKNGNNRVRACYGCNQARRSKPLLAWLLSLKRENGKIDHVSGVAGVWQDVLGVGNDAAKSRDGHPGQ